MILTRFDLTSLAMDRPLWLLLLLAFCLGSIGCAGVNTFPVVARPGDTVSVMIGGSEQARKNTVGVVLTDEVGGMWDLQDLGLVRSVFNLRPDAQAHGLHYSSYLDSQISWAFGHEPVQTVLVADIPHGVAPGQAELAISLNAPDNSSGISDPVRVGLEVLPGVGSSDDFLRGQLGVGPVPADLQALESAPYAKISFGGGTIIGAARLVIDVDPTAVNLDDINLYVPEAVVRGSYSDTGAFGDKQRMVYWRHDGTRFYVDVVAPNGIESRYLQVFLIHPRGIPAAPDFAFHSYAIYGVDGHPMSLTPSLVYRP